MCEKSDFNFSRAGQALRVINGKKHTLLSWSSDPKFLLSNMEMLSLHGDAVAAR